MNANKLSIEAVIIMNTASSVAGQTEQASAKPDPKTLDFVAAHGCVFTRWTMPSHRR